MELTTTERGFELLKFADIYDAPCTLQESSLADRHAIWLGQGPDRMHLDAELFSQLLPHICRMLSIPDPAALVASHRQLVEASDALLLWLSPSVLPAGAIPCAVELRDALTTARAVMGEE